VVVTIPDKEDANYPAWVHYVGELSQENCLLEYQRADALIYPSLLESYGLPLTEAMAMGLPILVADQPYAHALCGDDAIYFDAKSKEGLVEACVLLKKRMENGWYPDWSSTLATMPENWSVVAQKFLREF
jgi:glycosyltransferase involved in cell wall biosynthesis